MTSRSFPVLPFVFFIFFISSVYLGTETPRFRF